MSTAFATTRRRRQWGGDVRAEALPTAPPKASQRSMGANRGAIWVTSLAWLAYTLRTLKIELLDRPPTWSTVLPMVVYLVIVAALSTSALAYLIARQGFLYRSSQHTRTTRVDLDAHFADGSPSLTVLVPSYREDTRVIRQTLLSAALQEYDDMSIVLLVDDPANPTTEDDRVLLDGALSLPWELNRLLAGPAAAARNLLAAFDNNTRGRWTANNDELTDLATAYSEAADSLDDIAATVVRVDHTDDFLADQVVGRLADEFRNVAAAIDVAAEQGVEFTVERARQLHLRLVRVFTARVSAFQRKRFASLSHEPNKAMNLNSYLSLMGGEYTISNRAGLTNLVPVTSGPKADLVVPRTDYVLTLDADSVLLPEYCLRLVHIMEQPENERMAVTQTPYSAFPGAPTRLERLAGATTDLQHRVHQGLTHYGATYWVGANAILRRTALDDIATTEIEHGIPVVRYIHDRTVIEDTESSIDLGSHGWTLFNYGERLSYSATPPDFGSLAIQRQRWADGGLIILPKLVNQWRSRKGSASPMTFTEYFLRLTYLSSIAWSSICLVLVLVFPFSETLLSPLVVLCAAPYFLAQADDLHDCGYHRRDVARIYGFNMVLLAINLAGTLRSIGQAITGSKIAFARTPKQQSRTRTRAPFIALPLALIGFSVYTVNKDLNAHRWWHAAFASLNASTTLWAVVSLIGVFAALGDLVTGAVRFVYRDAAPHAAPRPVAVDWAVVLDRGTA